LIVGLYLCVFEDDEDLDGIDIGGYDDFHALRESIAKKLENGSWGSRFPVLMLHSDCKGEWSVDECRALDAELATIIAEGSKLPPTQLTERWQAGLAKLLGIQPQTMVDSFFDVDGEPLLQRMRDLCRLAIERKQPILFQ